MMSPEDMVVAHMTDNEYLSMPAMSAISTLGITGGQLETLPGMHNNMHTVASPITSTGYEVAW
jgi:hypothetical protein